MTQPRVAVSTIQRHETGDGEMTTYYMEVYARAFGIKPEELLQESLRIGQRERALLEVFNQLTPPNQSALLSVGRALAEQATPFVAHEKNGKP